MLNESELILACIAGNHNRKIIDKALNTLKQFTNKNGKLYLYDKNGNSFVVTPDTEWLYYETLEDKDNEKDLDC